jgi:tetratricopeptide (TPR) repeat protein
VAGELGPETLELAAPLNNLGALLLQRGEFKEAEAILLHSLAVGGQHLVAEDPSLAAISNLAETYRRQHRLAEAETMGRRALAIMESTLPAGHVRLATPLSNLANILADQGRFDEARVLYDRALAIRASPETLLSYASLLRDQHHPKEAKALEGRAQAMTAKAAQENQTDATVDWRALAFRGKN